MVWNKLNNKGLRFLGITFLILWILTFFEEAPYFGSFNFLWFCKISFFLLGMACITKDSRYILTFLAVGIIPETIWMFDFLMRIFNIKFIGATSFMFEYGQTPLQFALNLFHLFLLPSALLISRELKFDRDAKKQILIFGFIIATLGFYLSGLNVDINCVHNLCYPSPLNIDYGLAVVFAYLVICAFIIEPVIRKNIKKISKKYNLVLISLLFCLAIIGSFLGFVKYMEAPHYSCISNEKIVCERFFMDRVKNLPFLNFKIIGKKESCIISWKIQDEPYVMYQLNPEKYEDSVYLPTFEKGSKQITSEVICKD